MALWNQPSTMNNEEKSSSASSAAPSTAIPMAREGVAKGHRESVLGSGVTLEGRIEGDSDIRIAGTIKGEIRISGDLIVDRGAKLAAKVTAANVTLGGELEGNIAATGQIKLLESSQMIGDLKANTLTVAAGSRMRGHVEFGWSSGEPKRFVNDEALELNKSAPESKPADPASAAAESAKHL